MAFSDAPGSTADRARPPRPPHRTDPTTTLPGRPPIVARATWQAARDELLAREKAHTRQGDALAPVDHPSCRQTGTAGPSLRRGLHEEPRSPRPSSAYRLRAGPHGAAHTRNGNSAI